MPNMQISHQLEQFFTLNGDATMEVISQYVLRGYVCVRVCACVFLSVCLSDPPV